MKHLGKCLLTSVLLSVMACAALAQETKPAKEKETVEYIGKGDGLETCPVSGNPVKKEFKGEALGREFHACCANCVATVKKNPEAYLKPLPKQKTNQAGQKQRR